MDNDNVRFLLLGIVIAVFVPQMITFVSIQRNGRKISSDTQNGTKCGSGAKLENGRCVCENTQKFYNGEECVCDLGYMDDKNGGCQCAPGYFPNGSDCLPIKSKLSDKELETERAFHNKYNQKGKPFQTVQGMEEEGSIKHVNFYEQHKHEDTPGTTPAFGLYNQVGYTSMKDVLLANEQAALNVGKVLPFLGKSNKSRPILKQSRYENINIDRGENGDLPEPESTLHYGIDPRDIAADYATNSMGISANYPHTQLTEFSNGDLMTGFQPITSIHRPFILPEMVYRLPERKNERVLNGKVEGWKGHTVMPEVRHIDKLDVEGQVPYPVPSESKETSLYWQSEIPKRGERGIAELQIWQAGNPFSKVQSDVVPRGTEFRNREEPYNPDRVNHGFYGQYLNPLDNITNSQKAFYAGNDFETDYTFIRDQNDRMTRDDERVLPDPRQSGSNIDHFPLRSVEIERGTSNKVYNNSAGIHPTRQYDDKNIIGMPKRDQSIYQSRQMNVPSPYNLSDFQYIPESTMLDRNEILAVGPGVFTGV